MAKGVIKGLSRSGKFYSEAIESLRSGYDRPRLLHQTHIKMSAPTLKDGNGREVHCLHDTVHFVPSKLWEVSHPVPSLLPCWN